MDPPMLYRAWPALATLALFALSAPECATLGSGDSAGRSMIATRGSRPLEFGVYFVLARDREGARAVERWVVVR